MGGTKWGGWVEVLLRTIPKFEGESAQVVVEGMEVHPDKKDRG